MRLWLCLFFPFLSSNPAFAAGSPHVICESELNRAQIAAVRVLKLSMTLREVSPERLLAFGESSQWYNPLSARAGLPENLSLKKSFHRYTREMSDLEKKGVQEQALKLAEVGLHQDSLAGEAREHTDRVLSYKFERDLLPSSFVLGMNEIYTRNLLGRPHFVAKFENRATFSRTDTIALDPFNRSLEKRVIPNPEFTLGFSQFKKLDLFERTGRVIAIHLDEDKTFSLENGGGRRGATFQQAELPLSKFSYSEVILDSNQGHKAAVAFNVQAEKFARKLMLFDLTREGAEPAEIKFDAECHDLKAHQVNGRTFMTCGGMGYLAVYDVNENRVIYSTSDVETSLNVEDLQRVLYMEDGSLHLAYLREPDKNNREWRIQIVNLRTGRGEGVPNVFSHVMKSRFMFSDVRGVPHLYFFLQSGLAITNLRNKVTTIIPVAIGGNKNTRNLFQLPWNGHQFLIWSDANGSIVVFDQESESVLASIRSIPGKFLPFVYGRELYTLVSPTSGGLQLFRMSVSGKELLK